MWQLELKAGRQLSVRICGHLFALQCYFILKYKYKENRIFNEIE